MRNYLIFSSSAHFLLLALFFFLARNSFTMKKQDAYYIDFIGAGRVVTMDSGGDTPAEAAKAAPKAAKPQAARAEAPEDDSFLPKSGSEPLPKPSVLGGAAKLIEHAGPADAGAGKSGSPVVADFSNFPYPWYIAQVREALWNSWTGKMPSRGLLKCTVRFEIQRGGGAKRISVERSSGNRLFDYAAETSVENSAPFPPLPDDFYEDTLTVHVEFKTTD